MNKEYILKVLKEKGCFFSTIKIHDAEEYDDMVAAILRLKNDIEEDYEIKMTDVKYKNEIKSIILEILSK